MFLKNTILAVCSVIFLVGCGTIPASGPYSSNIKRGDRVSIKLASHQGEGSRTFRYALADINANLLDYLSQQKDVRSDDINWPPKEPADEITVNVGDTIQISIFESKSGGLFIPEDSSVRPGNFVSLPPQTIDFTGSISVPYAGKVEVAGKTAEQISATIEERLSNKAIEPQVVVSFNDRSGAEVSVIGNVNDPQRLSLGFNQYRILDAIASAGGPASPGYETKVSLQRNDDEYTIPFDELVMNAKKNIYSKINDIIYLYREPQTFTAYGAVQLQGNIDFGKRSLLLSEALGLARGLRDTQADPAEVYIYRQKKYNYFTDTKNTAAESNSKAQPKMALASDKRTTPSFKTYSKVFTQGVSKKNESVIKSSPIEAEVKEIKDESSLMAENAQVSVIFKLDMRKPSSFFLAQNFVMEDQDIIYVANAKSVEFLKFLNILGTTSTTTTSTDNVFPL